MFFDPEHEQMPREKIEQLQLERLKAVVKCVYENVPFYHRKLEEQGINPGSIQTLDDLAKLPFTTKPDFRDNYPYGLLAVPFGQVARIHASSGTTGKQIVALYTRRDIETWSTIMARGMATSGVVKGDIVQNAQGYGLFTGGLGFHYGTEYLGAAIVPTATGNTKRQLTLMHDLGTTVLLCTPSYALIVGETAKKESINLRKTKLRLVLCGAEPWSEKMRSDIESLLGVPAMDNYGLTEVMGPGVAMECQYKCGMHIPEDHFIAEIIDPQTGELKAPGEQGELVITTLTKEAYPVIRFRTRDITSLNPEPCQCGRTSMRMARVVGRTDDMLVVKGVNVFPSQIESTLLEIPGIAPHYLIVVERQHAFSCSDLEICAEISDEILRDRTGALEALKTRVRSELESTLGISTRVRLLEPGTLIRAEGKTKRIIEKKDLAEFCGAQTFRTGDESR